VRVALIYPPTADPTAPYASLPVLAGALRASGIDPLLIDANLEASRHILQPTFLAACAERVERRMHRLDRKGTLVHVEQLAYVKLVEALGDATLAGPGIAAALATLRDRQRFYDEEAYESAVQAVEAALRLVSAAYAPLDLSFSAYRTPFALLSPEEMARDAQPERFPYHAYLHDQLVPRLRAAGVTVAGLSVVFPGQLVPAYAFAHLLKQALPEVTLVAGGPAITQLLIRLRDRALARALGAFDAAVVFEAEQSFPEMCQRLWAGIPLLGARNVVHRTGATGTGDEQAVYVPGPTVDMSTAPSPSYDGLPLGEYLSPEIILPYDPTRGCYWGVCTFCHYGLAEVGTATYRERPLERVLDDLAAAQERHGADRFYLSQDSVSPKTLLKLAAGVRERGLQVRWGTDLRPEKSVTPERAAQLKAGGAVHVALGVESASERVTELIDKGIRVSTVKQVIGHLADAGIAVEAMCFTDFPTETRQEALATLEMLQELEDQVALFIVGEFDLTHGALVAQKPGDYGVAETWQVDGDELGSALFYRERRPSKSDDDHAVVDAALDRLAWRWRLRRYPWAGAISTAHTFLHYERFGPEAFHRRDRRGRPERGRAERGPERERERGRVLRTRYDVTELAGRSGEHELSIWRELVQKRRHVSRELYAQLARQAPVATPSPATFRLGPGQPPVPLGRRPQNRRRARPR
jgi:hypothetical protein